MVTYILANASDIATNVPGLDAKVREFCNTSQCLKEFLTEYFDGVVTQSQNKDWCCHNCEN